MKGWLQAFMAGGEAPMKTCAGHIMSERKTKSMVQRNGIVTFNNPGLVMDGWVGGGGERGGWCVLVAAQRTFCEDILHTH